MGAENIKKFELRLGRTGLILTVAGMAMLLCVSFILGVMVGEHIDTYPEKISSMPQRVLSFFWRPAKVASRQNMQEAADTGAGRGNIDLSFHRTLTGAKPVPVELPPVPEKVQEKEVAIDQNPSETVGQDLKPQAEEPLEKREATPSRKKDVIEEKIAAANRGHQKEEAAVSGSSPSSFFIHVASVKDKNKAEQIHKSVADLGYKSKVVKTDIKGKGIWYRIIATGFETRAQAKSAAEKISKQVKTTCIIRQTGVDKDRPH
jgi:cell division protein FtsN